MLIANQEVARRFQTSYQTINRIRKRYRRTGLFKDMPRSWQLKVTMRAEDRYIIMVWAWISAAAKKDLVFIDGNLNGQRYINEVLTPQKQIGQACHFSRFIMYRASLGEMFRNVLSKQKHTARSSAVPERRMGQSSTLDYPDTRLLVQE